MVQKIWRKVQVLLEGRRNSYVSIKLYEFRNRLESRWQEIFLHQRIVDIMEQPAHNVAEAESVNSFKGRLDQC